MSEFERIVAEFASAETRLFGPTQPGIHWPSCIGRACAGCMPALVADHWPVPTRCAPALGIHHNCEHDKEVS